MSAHRLLLATMLSSNFSETAGWSWSPAASGGPRVSGQSAASVTDDAGNDGVLLFGGLTGAAGSPTTNDLWRFDRAAGEWAQVSSDGDGTRPRRRMYAASAMAGTKFFLFGGWDPAEPGSGGEFLDDVWSFDFATRKWSEEEAKLPFPVSRHAAVAVGDQDRVVIHTYKGVLTFKDGKMTEQATKGDAPDSLSMCAMTSIGDKVVLFGGSDKSQRMSCDVYVLDTTDWEWTKLENPGAGPSAMASACMAPLARDRCVVFGGAGLAPAGYEGGYGLLPRDDTWTCTLSEKSVEWERVECDDQPEGRVAASLNDLGGGRFLLQGGYDPVSKSTFEQPWILSTTTA